MTAINPKILRWFEGRGIDPEVVTHIGIYSGQRRDTGEVTPHDQGDVIVFPFFRNGKVVNEKYRAAHKRIWQKPGGFKTFYNVDVLDDPALKNGSASLIIVEGEPDLLTALTCGFPHTVSVPDGAPPPGPAGDPRDEPSPDLDQKFSYIANEWDRLKLVKRIVLAVDNDESGKRLGEELVRRLGRARCSWVEYPEGCKDLNDVLRVHGPEKVREVIENGQPYPVHGLYALSGFPPEPEFNPLSTGWARMDDLLRVYYPSFMVITGFAGAGKTTWANQLVGQLALAHRWRTAIASYEMRLEPYVTDSLRMVFLQKPKSLWSDRDVFEANAWIEANFMFISPRDDDDEAHDIDWLLDRAAAAVIRHGIRVLLIDPWNEIEHARGPRESLTDYTGRALQALKRFGRQFDCCVIVVAHPTKSGAEKDWTRLSLYDVSDSAHFANKADQGVVICRVSDNLSKILVRKVRYQPDTGRNGEIDLVFDPAVRLFAQ